MIMSYSYDRAQLSFTKYDPLLQRWRAKRGIHGRGQSVQAPSDLYRGEDDTGPQSLEYGLPRERRPGYHLRYRLDKRANPLKDPPQVHRASPYNGRRRRAIRRNSRQRAPILQVRQDFTLTNKTCNHIQFPLATPYARTVHKSRVCRYGAQVREHLINQLINQVQLNQFSLRFPTNSS